MLGKVVISFKILKLLRIAVSLAFFVVLAVAFLALNEDAAVVAKAEFLPSAVRFLSRWGVAALIGVLVVIGVTLCFGRLYCSFCCPMGVLQDVAGRLGGLFGRRFRHLPDFRLFRYGFALVLIGFALGGVMLPLGLFDPFSLFGRNVNAFGQPVLVSLNNLVWNLWSSSGVVPMDPKPPVGWGAALVPALLLLAILAAAVWRGRVFCNSCCPVGALLGIIARFARRAPALNGTSCVKCGKCVQVCKAGCIDIRNGRIDSERCVGCFNCGVACPVGAIGFGKLPVGSEEECAVPDLSRRGFVAGAAALAVAAAGGAAVRRVAASSSPAGSVPVMPPGAGSFARFVHNCTGCQLCVANCIGRTLTPAIGEYGPAGIGLPRLSFEMGRCEFNCNNCTEVCPTGALAPLKPEEKRRWRVGLVEYTPERCIVVTDGTSCGACAEHCPTGALQMVPWRGALTIPEVIPEICIGCGGCEFICPVRPVRTVIVHGVASQERAADPAAVLKKESQQGMVPGGDFPF